MKTSRTTRTHLCTLAHGAVWTALLVAMSTFAHAADADGDGIDDASDNCPAISNPDQRDREGDGRGDACDVCPDVYDPSQRDRDGDHLGDACELWSDIVWIINGVDEPGYSNCAFSCGNTSSCRDRCGAAYRRAFLYTMDFTGAHRTEIPAGNRHVTLWDADLSPDGRRLAYYKADDPFYPGVTTPSLACVLDGHGTQCFDIPFQFSKRFSSDLTWGADSRTLYFALPDVMNFSRLRTDDSAPHREAMPSKSTVPVCRFTASPDGARMALVRRSNCNSSFGPLGFYDLATHGETFSYGPDSYFAPEYGPVGDILAWSRPINILCGFQQPCWTIWEGNSEKADPIDRASDSPGYRYIFPRFSPDGGEMFQLRWLENPYAWMEIRVVDRTSGAASMVASLGVNLTGVTYNGITDYDVSNAFFGDSDGDGIPYGRDNCPDVPNTAQDDYDGDLVGDVCDCARANDDSFDLPGEVTNLRYSFWSNTWNWTPSTIASGSGTRYQILRGPLEDLPVTGRSSDVCLAAAFEGVSMENTADAPAPGHGWWYLVGGWNACGNGTLGHRSTGPQRTSQACSEQFPIPVHDTNSPPRSE